MLIMTMIMIVIVIMMTIIKGSKDHLFKNPRLHSETSQNWLEFHFITYSTYTFF